jgi:hypothetical protein
MKNMKSIPVIVSLVIVALASSCKKDSSLKQAVPIKKDSTALKGVANAVKKAVPAYDYQKAVMAKRTIIKK